jgi:NAD(P)-dependent dehydrogenase (short-subunit alcohol dehydrogenase family)
VQIAGAVALVTGANRGIGRALAGALLAAGASKVYAAARDPAMVTDPGLSPVRLDVTRAEEVAAAAASCGEVAILVNNAGIARFAPLIEAADTSAAREEMETNYFGTLAMCRAFAPVLAGNGGGAIVNILSVVSWINVPMQGSYSASKAAAWSLTNGIRTELRAQGTTVIGVHPGYVETDMTAHVAGPKSRPEDIAARVVEALAAGTEEVLPDVRSRELRAMLSDGQHAVDAAMQRLWDGLNRR